MVESVENPELAKKIQSDRPHPARVWNVWLGGKDNYAVDREAAAEIAKVDPAIPALARHCRAFLMRAVRYLAGEAGIRQFLDIGTGLPTEQNTHEVAQAVAADSRVVYVDNDPLVLVHARALLRNTTQEGATTYLDADVREPETIIAKARNLLNFNEPIAVMLLGILGHAAPEFATMRSILDRLVAAVPSGSYLVLVDGARTDDVFVSAMERAAEVGNPYQLRTLAQFAECFEALELVEPGLVPVNQWRPDPPDSGAGEPCNAHGVLGRKP
jgi:hypothetical protein